MAEEPKWESTEAPPWAKQQQPAWEPVETPSWAKPGWGETAADIAKQVATAPVRALESAVTWPAQLLNLAGQGVEAVFGPGDPERLAEREQLRKAIEKQGGPGGIGQYLPEAKTPLGKYTQTGVEFATGAALSPGKLAVTVPAAVVGGLASEAAGQLTHEAGPATEGVARAVTGIGASLAGLAGLRAMFPKALASETARERLVNAFRRDNDTPEAAMQRLADVQKTRPDATLVDVANKNVRGLLENIAQSPGAGGARVGEFLEARQKDQLNRLATDLTAGTGTQRTAYRAIEESMAARKADARPLYQQAYADGDRAIWSPELERLTGASSVKRAMRGAVRNWQDQAIADGYGSMNPGALVDRPGTAGGLLAFGGGKVPVFPNLQFWDYVKNDLDLQYRRSIRETGPTKESARLASFLTQLRGELDSAVPTYAQARNAYAGPSAYMDAIKEGQSILGKGTAEEMRDVFRVLSPSEQEAFRIGAVSEIRSAMSRNPAKMADLTRYLRSPEMRAKLEAIMPSSEAAERFRRALDYEVRSSEVVGQSLANSATYRRLAQQEDAHNVMNEMGMAVLAGHPKAAALLSIGRWTKAAREKMLEQTREELAKTFTTPRPNLRRPQHIRLPNLRGTIQGTAIGLGASNDQQESSPRQAGGGVPAIGGTGGRSPGARASTGAREARAGPIQALQDGGAARNQAGPTIKRGTREHFAALLGMPVHGGTDVTGASGGSRAGKAPTGLSREDIAYYLRRRGITGEALGSFDERLPEPMQEGGEVEEKGDAFEAAAARVRRRHPTREPSPVALAASRAPAGAFWSSLGRSTLQAPEAAFETAGKFHRTGEYEGELFPLALGLVGAPGVAGGVPGMGAGIRKPPGPPRLRAGEVPAADRPVTRGHNLPPEEGPLVPIPPRERRTSSLSLRDMPIEQAIEQAKTEQHVIPSNPKVREGYVGAPDWVKTPEDLQRMRDSFDAQVESGAGGAKWYREAQEGIKELAGPEPERQHLLAQEKAVTSAQATPETNLGFVLQGHNAMMAGRPLSIVRTGKIAEAMKAGIPAGEIKLGKKTGIYSRHMDPTMEDPATGTNDIWHARAWGYENPEGGMHAQQHAFMDAETVLAVDRANKKKLAGRDDWTTGEVQAAPWVFNKAQGLQEQFGWSPEKAYAEALKTYRNFFEKHTAYGTHEATPGIGTRHRPEIAEGSEATRKAFAEEPSASWRDPTGRDIFYRALGMWTRPTSRATGVFEGPRGLEINPAEVARPMVSFTGKSGLREVDPASRRLMDAAEAARAYIDAQNAGAWSIPIAKQQTGVSTSLFAPRPGGGPLPLEDIGRLRAIGERHGLPGVIDYGEGTALTSFGGGPTGRQLAKAGREGLGQEVEAVVGRQPQQVKLDTGYVDYQSLWGKAEGTGAVTRALKKYLVRRDAPDIIRRLDASPGIRHAVAARLARDAEAAAQTGAPIRADLQRARQLIIDGGFAGLFEALKQGAAVPALALAPLVKLLAQQEEPVE